MKLTNMFLGTLREAPAEATNDAESYKLMLRGGIIRKHSQGEYNLLPLGMKVYDNLIDIISNSFNNQSFLRSGLEIEDLSIDIKTYKQFPMGFYSIKDEITNEKPKYGLMKSKKFTNIQGFSLHRNLEELDKEYKNMEYEFNTIFNQLNIPNELIFGYCYDDDESKKIITKCELGDDLVVECTCCNYKASMDAADSLIDNVDKEKKDVNIIYTPNIKSIDDLANFFKISSENIVKTLIYKLEDEVIAVLIRGNRELDENKLKKFLKSSTIEMADATTVQNVTNADVGFAGPIGINVNRILVDEEVTKMANFIVGANKTDHHIENVNYSKDFKGEVGNFRKIVEQDKCPKCGNDISINSCFTLATLTKSKENKILSYDEEDGKIRNPYIASYKIGITRNMAVTAEYNRDENGIKWPVPITPYHVVVVVAVGKNQQQILEGEKIYKSLLKKGIRVLFDDREDRAGAKFKDCDLIGSPFRITVGKKISEGLVELKKRRDEDFSVVTIDDAVETICKYFNV